MVANHLTAVPSETAPSAAADVYELGRTAESGVQRVQRLQHEAHMLAREQVEILVRDFTALAARAAEIAEGGDAYPAGVRDIAARIAEDLPHKVQGMIAILDRSPQN